MKNKSASLTACLSVLLLLTFRAPALSFLHTRGQDMVNDEGEKVLLRGVGLGNWMLPEGYMWRFGNEADRPRRIEHLVSSLLGEEEAARFWSEFRQNYVTEADIERISELGFNAVRPSMNARLFLTEGAHPTYLDEGFTLVDNLVAACKKHGVYVILDMHAAPGGQTGQNIDDSADDQPRLFMDKQNQDLLVELWVKLANRYKDEPTVAAYDLLNEPLPERTGAAGKYKTQLQPLYRRITSAIRQIDKKHMITIEGADWANEWSVFTKPFDHNLFYQFHYYCWDRPETLKGISQYLADREKFNAPIWVGETGEKDETIYWGTTQYFESKNVGWSFWPWKKLGARNAPYSIKPPDGWDDIAAYSRGGAKPSRQAAQKTLAQYLQNIQLKNCEFYPKVVNAIFRRVPVRVEAENYGTEGLGKAFFIADCSQQSKHYRTSEPVPIVPVEGGDNRGAGQAIKLGANEWTAYSVGSQSAQSCEVSIRTKTDALPAAYEWELNGKTKELTLTETGWHEVRLGKLELSQGDNRFKLKVKQGSLEFDWVNFQ